MEEITIEEALVIVSGNYAYQIRVFLILMLGQISLSFYVMGLPFIFPLINCEDINTCKGFENTATIEFELINEKQDKISLVGTFYFLGMMVGSIVTNWSSDRYGRKRTIRYSNLFAIPLMILLAISWNFSIFCITTFGVGIIEVGIYSSGFVLCTEIIEKQNRNFYAALFFSIWSFAATIVAILYYFGINWRLVMCINAILLILELFLLIM